jgi:hypothetical protein
MVYDIDIHQLDIGPYKKLEVLDKFSFWMTLFFGIYLAINA